MTTSFAFLPAEDRRHIAAHVLRLADLLDEPEPTAIPDPGAPPSASPDTIVAGSSSTPTLAAAPATAPREDATAPRR
jgi:hypothetical protein